MSSIARPGICIQSTIGDPGATNQNDVNCLLGPLTGEETIVATQNLRHAANVEEARLFRAA
jgi:hypothetical protein